MRCSFGFILFTLIAVARFAPANGSQSIDPDEWPWDYEKWLNVYAMGTLDQSGRYLVPVASPNPFHDAPEMSSMPLRTSFDFEVLPDPEFSAEEEGTRRPKRKREAYDLGGSFSETEFFPFDAQRIANHAGGSDLCGTQEIFFVPEQDQEDLFEEYPFWNGNIVNSVSSDQISSMSDTDSTEEGQDIQEQTMTRAQLPYSSVLTPEIRKDIIERIRSGASYAAIGRQVWPEASQTSVRRLILQILKQAKIKPKIKHRRKMGELTEEECEEVARLYAEGKDFEQIKSKFWPYSKLSVATKKITKILQEKGFKQQRPPQKLNYVITEAQEKFILEGIKSKKTPTQIARELWPDICESTGRRRVNKYMQNKGII
ncbi:MAG: hypothetical protein ACK5O7_07385 [Holosporales bacterium]